MSFVISTVPQDDTHQLLMNIMKFAGGDGIRKFGDLTNNGISKLEIVGVTDTFNANFRQLHPGAAGNEYFTFPSANTNMDVSSDATADTAQVVLIKGYQSDGTAVQESVTVNGQNRVQLTANTYYRITSMVCTTNTETTPPFADGGMLYCYERSGTTLTAGVPDFYCGKLDLSKRLYQAGYTWVPPNYKIVFYYIVVVSDTASDKILGHYLQYKKSSESSWMTLSTMSFQGSNSHVIPVPSYPVLSDSTGLDVRICINRLSGATNIQGCQSSIHCDLIPP